MTGETDHELVAKALRGNQKAFKALAERCHGTVYSVVRGVLGDSDDVDDVVQNVYIKVYKGLSGFRGDSKLSTWVYQIARNEAINATRKRRPEVKPLEDIDLRADAEDRPDLEYGRRETSERVNRAMSELDDNYRMALELRYMGERSYEEIAELMGLPIGTVKTYIYRGKAKLKKVMADRPGRPSSKR